MADYVQLPPWNKPFNEQLAFFKQKLNLPSERWDDIMHAAHDKAFMVAGAQNADLLADLHAAVSKAIDQGLGLDAFRKDFKALVAKHGWSGWTGEDSKAGVAWRTKVIYQTNMSTSYAAGRWQQLNDPDLLKATPYWRYKHSDSVLTPRPLHVSWDGLTLPHDHAFWTTHFPPNGWGCHCRVTPVNKAEFMQAVTAGRGPANAPALGNTQGIDTGFAYAPGANVDLSLRQVVQDKLITYPPAISKALTYDVNRRINAHEEIPNYVRHAIEDKAIKDPLWLGFVENDAEVSEIVGQDVNGYLVTLPPDTARHVENSHGYDGGDQRPPQPEDFNHLIQVLNDADDLRQGESSRHGQATVVARKSIGGEMFRAVFEVLPGKKNRALALLSFLIKQGKGGG
ncbi:phage minor head protein [Undibacterium sp. Xuan67W]|uniref:phage minor head protein n=1 Tax=Undibacterium sp. Xuan67W TaxID=3413057 RepID=UPI003BF01574